MKRIWLLLSLFAMAPSAFAHVGSQDIYYDGNAGPYHLYVTVRMPQTVPGIATVEIRSTANDIREIRLAPMALLGSTRLSPVPDVARRSDTDPQFFTGSVWLMEPNGFQIHIQVDGDRGHGELGVPGTALPQSVLPMQQSLGVVLFVLMLTLAAGLVGIIGASVREAQLEPGVQVSPWNSHRGRTAMVIAAIGVVVAIGFGDLWWRSDARIHLTLTQPVHLRASLESGNHLVLDFPDGKVETRPGVFVNWTKFLATNLLLPDHDHLMHLFLVRTPEMDVFWHLHPTTDPKAWFATDLPSLPAGHYRLFADIVRITGAAPTLIGDIDLPEVHGRPSGGDDAGSAVPSLSSAHGEAVSQLPDGSRIVWERDGPSLQARTFTLFRFRIEDKNGKPATDVEPYMGMAGHAEFIRSDLSTFAHVHPMGDVAMAAVQLADASLGIESDATAAPMPATSMPMTPALPLTHLAPEVSFPYGFPSPGSYRIFVQIKRAGRIETGVFDAKVN